MGFVAIEHHHENVPLVGIHPKNPDTSWILTIDDLNLIPIKYDCRR